MEIFTAEDRKFLNINFEGLCCSLHWDAVPLNFSQLGRGSGFRNLEFD